MSSLDFDMLSPEGLRNPWRWLGQIQKCDAVFWSDIQQAWLVTKLDDVRAGFRDKRLSSARLDLYLRQFDADLNCSCPLFMKYAPLILSFIDPRVHTRIRSLVVRAFSPPVIERVRMYTRDAIHTLLDICEQQCELDFAARISYELPTSVIMSFFGFPTEHRAEFGRMAEGVRNTFGSSRPKYCDMLEFERALGAVFVVLERLISEAEKAPRGNFLGELIQARDEDSRLSHDELLSVCLSIVSAAIDTTAASIGLFTRWIAADSKLQHIVRSGPVNAAALVNEMLRYPGQSKSNTRVALESFEWSGKHIRKGDFLFLMQNAANVDSNYWTDPFEIDIKRDTRNAVPFGYGAHHCIGFMLAKMELTEFLPRLFECFDVELLDTDSPMLESYVFTGYKSLPLRMTPRGRS